MTQRDDYTRERKERDKANQIPDLLRPYCKDGKVVEWNGHFSRGVDFYDKGYYETPEKRLLTVVESLGLQLVIRAEQCREACLRLYAALRALKSKVPAKRAKALAELEANPVEFPDAWKQLECSMCGESLRLAFNGHGIIIVGTPCKYADGLHTIFEINVPSGRIIVANDLRQWFPTVDKDSGSGLLSTHLTTMSYANVGLAHGFVGNSCPGVWRAGDHYAIGNYSDTIDEWDEKTDEYSEYPNPEPCPWDEKIGGICTDLWWYSLADADEFERRLIHYGPEEAPPSFYAALGEFINVRPGVYRFEHHTRVDRDAPTCEFATFTWVRDPDPVRDYLAEERAIQLTATEVLIQHCLDYPTLYMDLDSLGRRPTYDEAVVIWRSIDATAKLRALARAADHVICVNGNGLAWHPNGFPRTSIDEPTKELAAAYGEVPAFNFQRSWYPISEGFCLLCDATDIRHKSYNDGSPRVHMNPSFVRLSLNVCQSAIVYGDNPHGFGSGKPGEDVKAARKRMKLYLRCYMELRRLYPDIVFDGEFDAYVQREGEKKLLKAISNFTFPRDVLRDDFPNFKLPTVDLTVRDEARKKIADLLAEARSNKG